jgi:hypothetical protein
MKKLFTFLVFLAACNGIRHQKKVNDAEIKDLKFNRQTIELLPVYDSMRQLIMSHYDQFPLSGAFNEFVFHDYETDSVKAVLTGMPADIFPAMTRLLYQVDSQQLNNFVLSQDRTLKFTIAEWKSEGNTYYERLFWYPRSEMIKGARVKRMDYSPRSSYRDTLLQNNWVYEMEIFPK